MEKRKQKKSILATLNNPILAVIVLAGFIWLAQYSLHYKPETLAEFSARKVAEYEAEKRAKIMEVYSLTESDIAKPVNLWGNK